MEGMVGIDATPRVEVATNAPVHHLETAQGKISASNSKKLKIFKVYDKIARKRATH